MSKNVPPLFSVIIVSWNVAEELRRCLDSLLATRYGNLEIIVVDNASCDHSVSLIKSHFRKVKLVVNDANLGFPAAVNQGLKESKGDYLVLLNPDARVFPDFFTKCLEFFEGYPNAALMGPMFVNEGSVYNEPSILNTVRIYWFQELLPKYTPHEPIPVEVNALAGACLAMPRRTYEQAGSFTEEVFMYFEDLDYCRRLRQLKLAIFFNPFIRIRHEHGSSAKQTPQNVYKYFWETAIYPIRQFLGLRNHLPTSARYHNEAAIWYNGWLRQVIITAIIWLARKTRRRHTL